MSEIKEYDVIVVGFGKAGKTIAMKRAKAGDRVAIVERSAQMYGGTCINIGCVPTKTLLHWAREYVSAAKLDGKQECCADRGQMQQRWDVLRARRNQLITKMNAANLAMVQAAGAQVIDGSARFIAPKTLEVAGKQYTAETIIINTGAESAKLSVEGADLETVVNSTQIQFVEKLPRRLAIIGGGPIGLEFGTLFAELGTEVTVLDRGDTFLPRVDQTVAQKVRNHLVENAGFTIHNSVQVQRITRENEDTVVHFENAAGEAQKVCADLVLAAAGRVPATEELNLAAAKIATTERGFVQVDTHLHTSVAGVYAAGDVAGSPQFTYVSFDDHRVIMRDRWGDAALDTNNRLIPTTTFIHPPLATVGETEEQLRARGATYMVREADIANIAVMPRPKIIGNPTGCARIFVGENDQILGATLWCVDAQELINTVTLAMNHGVSATDLGQGIYTHPASHELFNGLLG